MCNFSFRGKDATLRQAAQEIARRGHVSAPERDPRQGPPSTLMLQWKRESRSVPGPPMGIPLLSIAAGRAHAARGERYELLRASLEDPRTQDDLHAYCRLH
jgi:hypothetical protein